jgi:hypothetical protein
VLGSRLWADDLCEGNMMDFGRLARESQVLLAAVGLVVVGLLWDQLSLPVVMVTVVAGLTLGWNGVTAVSRERS